MMIQESCGVRGKRKQQRIDIGYVNDTFVRDFSLTNFQKEALEVIYNIRAVKISQLMKITGYCYTYVCDQMLQLHLNRFVLRNIPKNPNTKGSEESYFLLDDAGAIYIAGSNDIPLKDIKWAGIDNLIKYDKLKHTFRIASVCAVIEEEARRQKHKVIECLADRHLYMKFKFDDKDYGLRPDMFLNYSDNEQMYTYFFEIDLGTVHATGGLKTNSFDDKVASYESLKLSGEYEKKYSVFPRIIVITTNTKRAELLREAVREKQKARVEFLFTTFPLFEDNPLGPIFKKTDGSFTKML